MKILVALIFCCIQYIPLEGLQLQPYLPSLASPSERAKFLQAAAATGDAALIGYIHQSDPLAWASGDGWRRAHGTTALHAAAESRNALAVRALIALGADLRAVDAQGRSPLHITARSDYALGATVELLDAGAEVDATTMEGVTPLMEAVRNRAPKTVSALLNAGADRTKATFGGFSVLTLALQMPRSDVQTWILGLYPVPDHRYDHEYRCDQPERTESRFIGSPWGNSTDSLFRASLHISCDTQYSRNMVSARDLFFRTPLHSAVMRRDKSCVKKLLDMGADTEAVDWLKRTPLQIAKICRLSEIINLLNSKPHA